MLRQVIERSGIVPWMTDRLIYLRNIADVTRDLASLFLTSVPLAAQGWRDHDDADALRYDPAFRLEDARLLDGPRDPEAAEGQLPALVARAPAEV
ncbi:MAG: hypothetical protein V2I43_20980 [Parvularcula sp.]|jgi:hypothetical protein|nr:hypothetical protein [Parvularcula sp.]